VIQEFRSTHVDETALIVGNGPSLDTTPLMELARKYPTFAANKIYDSATHPEFIPNFWTCIDDLMLTDCVPWLIAHPEFISERFVPRHIPLARSHGLNTIVDVGFSMDTSEKVYLGGTVTYVNLQLAKYMGFSTVLLVGVDHNYPKAAAEGKPGSKMIADGDDPDHFKGKTSAYFSPGKLYNRPELGAVEKYFFPLAKRAFGGRVINLTPGSAENVFDKQSWSKWV
jgi:hypothetical protein